MTGLLDGLYLLSLAAWVGGTAFFTFVVAPDIHKSLDSEKAGLAVATALPHYYLLGYVCGGVGLFCLLFLWQVDETSSIGHWVSMECGMLAITALLDRGLGRKIAELRGILEAQPSAILQERLAQLEKQTVWLNYALIAVGVLLLLFTSQRLQYY